MEVGSIEATEPVPPIVARPEPAPADVAPDPRDPELDVARLSAVVELIRTLTGREVKLVPPAAYFMSPPGPASSPTPAESPRVTPAAHRRVRPELVVATGINPEGPETDPLEVDISQLLRDGTSDRMVLGERPSGGLMLVPGIDLEL